MNRAFCISVRSLDSVPAFHGRRDDGEPEWPPSPLRLFQALVAASGLGRESRSAAPSRRALQWLEQQTPPHVVAPPARTGLAIRMAVPNNDLNVVAGAWAKRLEPR